MTLQAIGQLAIFLLGGAGLGAVCLYLLSRSVAALEPRGGYLGAAAWLVPRLAMAAAALGWAATQGADALIVMLLGFVALRSVVIGRLREG